MSYYYVCCFDLSSENFINIIAIWTSTIVQGPMIHIHPPPNDPLSPLAPRCHFILWAKCYFMCFILRCISKRYPASLYHYTIQPDYIIIPFTCVRYISAFDDIIECSQIAKEVLVCSMHCVWVGDIRCDTCGAGRIYKAALEFLPINWQTDIYLKHLTCLQQPNS